jgi:8-oxo-dGTP pyrophosphatase MutT (NUDIX family)
MSRRRWRINLIDYIKNIRAKIGHDTLYVTGCGILLIKDGKVLLQLRKDSNRWCIPGGLMGLGETFLECAIREVLEETGLTVNSANLFGIYSGSDFFAKYPNGDKIYSPNVIFISEDFTGDLHSDKLETIEHKYFGKSELPQNIVELQKHWILGWANGEQPVVVK